MTTMTTMGGKKGAKKREDLKNQLKSLKRNTKKKCYQGISFFFRCCLIEVKGQTTAAATAAKAPTAKNSKSQND